MLSGHLQRVAVAVVYSVPPTFRITSVIARDLGLLDGHKSSRSAALYNDLRTLRLEHAH